MEVTEFNIWAQPCRSFDMHVLYEYVAMAAGHANTARRMPDLHAMQQFTASLMVTLSLQTGA